MAIDNPARPDQPAAPEARPAPELPRAQQSAAYRRASRVLPGGTDSNFRAWGERTVYVDRGKGGRVWDLDGNEFIDLRMGYGPVILFAPNATSSAAAPRKSAAAAWASSSSASLSTLVGNAPWVFVLCEVR